MISSNICASSIRATSAAGRSCSGVRRAVVFMVTAGLLICYFVSQGNLADLRKAEAEQKSLRQPSTRSRAKRRISRPIASSSPRSSAPSARCCASCPARPRCRLLVDISQTGLAAGLQEHLFQPGRRPARTSTRRCRSRSSCRAATTSSAISSAASRRCRASSRCTTSRSRAARHTPAIRAAARRRRATI